MAAVTASGNPEIKKFVYFLKGNTKEIRQNENKMFSF
jgi:hypothetical protein